MMDGVVLTCKEVGESATELGHGLSGARVGFAERSGSLGRALGKDMHTEYSPAQPFGENGGIGWEEERAVANCYERMKGHGRTKRTSLAAPAFSVLGTRAGQGEKPPPRGLALRLGSEGVPVSVLAEWSRIVKQERVTNTTTQTRVRASARYGMSRVMVLLCQRTFAQWCFIGGHTLLEDVANDRSSQWVERPSRAASALLGSSRVACREGHAPVRTIRGGVGCLSRRGVGAATLPLPSMHLEATWCDVAETRCRREDWPG
ncbi:hypothetical protein BDW22DRAFT_1344527 [Trametopsis cervina]|nr:hypothetical protein BDW22DRAFT_1344527 [Trametopsis cervina]